MKSITGVLSAIALFVALSFAFYQVSAIEITGWKMQDKSLVSQTGAQISASTFASSGWYAATVPGTALSTLVDNHVYPDPYFGLNNQQIPDNLKNKHFWYQTNFTVPASFSGKRVWLTLKGISYKADVYANGTKLTPMIQGIYQRGIFDITANVAFGGSNGLAVDIYPLDNPVGENSECHMYVCNGTDGAPFMQANGNHWLRTVRDRNIGIWRAVMLDTTGPVVLRDPFVKTDLPLPQTSPAVVTVSVTLANATAVAQTGTLRGSIGAISFEQSVSLNAYEKKTVTFSPTQYSQLSINNPRLWWPVGHGTQELYTLALWFDQNGIVSDRDSVNFGVRKVTVTNRSDNTYAWCSGGQSSNQALKFAVNGKPILIRGGTIGADEMMKRFSYRRGMASARLYAEAGINLVRLYTGGCMSEGFFDGCDKYGVLVWDEFGIDGSSCGSGPTGAAADVHLANISDKIRQLRNHPCLAIWVGANEGTPNTYLDTRFRDTVNALDGTHIYFSNSWDQACGVASGGPYGWANPQEYFSSNHSGIFTSEIGLGCVITADGVRAMMSEADAWPISATWTYHNWCVWMGPDQYVQAVNDRFGTCSSIDEFCRKGQAINYESHRALYEGWNNGWGGGASGLIFWQSQSSWRSLSWQFFDYDLEAHGGYFGLKKACEPVHIQADPVNWNVKVINNTSSAIANLTVLAKVYNKNGQELGSQNSTLAAAANTATSSIAITWPSSASQTCFLRLVLKKSTGDTVSVNDYWRSSNNVYTDLNSLSLDTVKGTAAMVTTPQGEVTLTITLQNAGSSMAFMAFCKLVGKTNNARILPAYYNDNYFELLPGEKKVVQINFSTQDGNGQEPKILVSGYNVPQTEIPITSQNKETGKALTLNPRKVSLRFDARRNMLRCTGCGNAQLEIYTAHGNHAATVKLDKRGCAVLTDISPGMYVVHFADQRQVSSTSGMMFTK